MGGKALWRQTGLKTCKTCSVEKSIEQFKFNSQGIPGWCLECTRDFSATYQKIWRTPEYARAQKLASAYNMTSEDFTYKVLEQGGKCAICEEVPQKILYVDHNHDTGTVRGLLCQKCNSGLGFFKDDIDLVKKALSYLTQYTEVEGYNV